MTKDKIHNTQQNDIHSKLFWPKIGLSPELIRNIFEFMEQQNSLRMISQFRPREPNDKIWCRKI